MSVSSEHDAPAQVPAPAFGTRHIRLDLAFHGQPFKGWQKQPRVPTVQDALEDALAKLFGEKVMVCGAGRTDAGVHARQMVCHFRLPRHFDLHQLLRALNALTPRSIMIYDLKEVSEKFHARHTHHEKTYRYSMNTGPFADPLTLDFCHHDPTPRSMDEAAMKKFVSALVGTHDFACFCSSGNTTKTTQRIITGSELLREEEHGWIFEIRGNGFLQHMVRILAGTLLGIGKGELDANEMIGMLGGVGGRYKAGVTLPAHGLCLEKIRYFGEC